MIDIESAGLPPTGALMGLGACFFNTKERAIGPTFYRTIHLATSVREGGTMDPATIMWWLGQSEAARNEIRFSGYDIRQALTEFAAWIPQTCRTEDVRVWGNASGFDCTLVEGAYKRMGLKTPWHFVNERCFRTTRSQYPKVVYDPSEKGEGAHNALADSKFQAQHLFKIADWIKGGRNA